MKCPKCGYVSHDYLNACRKCQVDLLGFKAQMQLHVVQSDNIDLRSVLGGVQPSPMASGEFDSLFDSPMLIEAQGEDGFDINLEDDFSFAPSGMSLESLDGFEVSNIDSTSLEQLRPADTGNPEAEPSRQSDTGYATVMMDVNGLNNEDPPLESAGSMFDAPMELPDPTLDPPMESADGIIELPDLPVGDALIEPDLTSAELRSSVGRTSDLDLTSMELKRTTRDIEIMNQLKNEVLSGDVVLPGLEEFAANQESADRSAPSNDGSDHSDPEKTAITETGQQAAPPDDAASSFTPALPGVFAEEEDDIEDLNQESGELILPTLDADFVIAEDTSQSGSASNAQEDSFTMPDLPDLSTDDEPVNPFTEEISLAIDPLSDPEPLPMDFPSLQTGIFPGPVSEAPPPVNEAPASEPAQPVPEDDRADDTSSATITLDLGHADSPEPDGPFVTAASQEASPADEPPPPLPVEPEVEPAASSDTGYATIALDLNDLQSPEAPVFPDLPEPTDDPLRASSPDEATIVDEPSPFASTARPPTDLSGASADTGSATIELDMNDIHTSDEPIFPDLPKQTDALLTPSPDEATIVDEPSPFASTGHTPIDFTIAPPHTPNTDYATIEMDIGDTPSSEAPGSAPVFPDLPENTDALLTPLPDEATIVDEPSPLLPTDPALADTAITPPEPAQPDADALDEDLDLELLFPDEQPPQQHD
ncbi:MAG: hypothetical protein ETSY2_46615 [Candidatus Entotheonella gemina]|uniref:Uncharacterized protein n=1 Tax=Candidatus Entotheonella gemina TaxID=1429439 RepID=W4LF73_9BACT|nr:MAG: hypothetical protein ETSY2_46615 [Candidatus Entotheonella gemina]